MAENLHIALIEPFFTGSHRQWAEGLQKYSSHRIEILSLPGRHWKWRMRGAAVTLAAEYTKSTQKPDLLIATDMLDLATFKGLSGVQVPTVLYFHENQITYPWSAQDPDSSLGRDFHYGFTNFTSALCADYLLFNSKYHQDLFFAELPVFLNKFPDFRPLDTVQTLPAKSALLYPGIDLQPAPGKRQHNIIFNHRWEYDKNPEEFFQLIEVLARRKLDFQLIVTGESFRKVPAVFQQAREKFADRINHWGYVDDISQYESLLQQATLAPVTSIQDNFGISVVEAAYCGATPVLPDRLSYSELFGGNYIYRDFDELVEQCVTVLEKKPAVAGKAQSDAGRFHWQNLIAEYDKTLLKLAGN